MEMKYGLIIVGVMMLFLPQQSWTAPPPTTQKPQETQPQNKTIEQIMTDQTEAVRKIIEAQRQTDIDYPVVTKKEENIEEVKLQCEELLKQKQKTTTAATSTTMRTTQKPEEVRAKPLGPFVKPNLNANRRRFNGVVNENGDNVKLIKFEPVILQKTIMKDGQVVYYWHKSLPFPQYLVINPEEQQKVAPTTTTTTTTTTTEKPIEPIYGNQLRFVVPMTYPSAGTLKNSGNYDPFAYFSKYMHQQHAVPVEVPVPPTLPIIKTLLIPNKYLGEGNENTNSKP